MARILAIEDDHSILALITAHLRKHGHRVQGASNGHDALTLVDQKGAPDVVVLDIGLPDIDGRDLLVRLREQTGTADLPAIFLTGKVEDKDVESGRALGARYLTKPIILSALLNAVERSVPTEEGW